ncbi:MAG: multicopper oxidase domain-containing protein, partial [Candidatus Eremiobacteraeota bacterium]|nr:multicopper oxidase domain-containing protein [Candidatus Eremiobacteraeota bacterium]
PGHNFLMTWRAVRPGNWLFHCHLTYHTMAHLPIDEMLKARAMISADTYENTFLRHAGMGGLILAVSVLAPQSRALREPPAARRVGLLVEPAADNQPDAPSFKYVLTDGNKTITEPGAIGPPIVLTRGVPVAIAITNRLNDPTSIHWHGMELQDSYYDGVPGYSGEGAHVAPMVDPGQTFEVHLDPPRPGTFIYHTHMNDVYQLRGGLAGPLIVLEPGARFDPNVDHVFTVTTTHRLADALKIFVNGSFQPPPLIVQAGVAQRLRIINMTTFWTNVVVSLSSANKVLDWQPIAVDGAELAFRRRTAEPAVETVTIGGTADFMFTPQPGDSQLQIWPATGVPPVTILVHATAR